MPRTNRFMQADSLVWLLAGALLYLSFGYTEMQGSDLWWHLAAGREIVQGGTVWISDSWSYTSGGSSWANHEWLADILYYAWVRIFGLETLVYWKWLVVIITYLLLQLSLNRSGGQRAASFVCVAMAVAVAAPFIDVRPHLYSLLGFTALLLLLLNRTASTWKLVLLFVVWVNVHGGFIFGLMGLGILLFPWRDLRLQAFYKPARTLGLCTLACLLNPDGINSFLLPFVYALNESSPYRQLGEWLSPFARGGIQAPLYVWALGVVPVVTLGYAVPLVRRQTNVPWEGLALTGLTLLMSLTSRRFIPLFAIALAVMSAPLLAFILKKMKAEKIGLALALVALGWGAYRMLPYSLNAGPAYHYLTAEYTYPIDTLDFIEANEIEGKIFALYNWGGYIHWRTSGDLKVFIDGRANTVYDDKTYNHYVSVLRGEPGWQELIEASGAQYILWPNYRSRGADKLGVLLDSGRWQGVYQDSVSYLLARSTMDLPKEVKRSTITPYRILTVAELSARQGNATSAANYAEQVLQQIPYQRSACNLAVRSHRRLGSNEKADAIAQRCKSYFPSKHLLK